jgi:hypothetical protein
MRILLAVLCLFVTMARAAPDIPRELGEWSDWVLKDQDYRRCPLMAGASASSNEDFICLWPGVLNLSSAPGGAQASQTWQVEAAGWVPLPGSAEAWPQSVTVNGQASAVVDRNGPALWLEIGTHRVQARFDWTQRPQNLRVPEMIKRVSLEIDGVAMSTVQRRGDQLVLGRPTDAAHEADSLDLRVFRRYDDGLPGTLETRLQLDVSGQAREEVLGPVLPEGFAPLVLDTDDWPARLDDDGLLHVQVEAGHNEILLTARALEPSATITARLPKAWASQEIWSYAADNRLRNTQARADLQVDPQQADVPSDWQNLPAWAMSDGAVLTLSEQTRGADPERGNDLGLEREAWLDFSGRNWFMRDRIMGQMNNGWRLDTQPPYLLQRASNGSSTPLLVTTHGGAKARGVEWRTTWVDLNASLRVNDRPGILPLSGWQQTFNRGVKTTLHLPYGYRLIAAPGTDRDNGSWLSRWTLLDIFSAAILCLLAWRLLGPTGAGIAVACMVLGYHEVGSPFWSILLVLALALTIRALPSGRLVRLLYRARQLALIVLILVAVPFIAGQVRSALHPQLKHGDDDDSLTVAVTFIEPPVTYDEPTPMSVPAPSPTPATPAPQLRTDGQTLESVQVSGSRLRKQDSMRQYSQSTVIQTGTGEPDWTLGSQHRLVWSGPITAEQDMHLIIAPPWLVRLLRIVLAGLLGWWIWKLLRLPPPVETPTRNKASAVALLGLIALLASPGVWAQDFPPDNLLNELRQRLTEAPRCAPDCASIAQMQVVAEGDEIRLRLEVHAAAKLALPLPVENDALSLRALSLDGQDQAFVTQKVDHAWLPVDRGVHWLELSYASHSDRVSLAFPLPPHRVSLSMTDWQTSSLHEAALLSDTLALSRSRSPDNEPETRHAQQFTPYVRVIRELQLDLQWSAETRVERMAPEEGGFTVAVPLMPGEHVSTTGIQVKDAQVMAALGDVDNTLQWSASLDPSGTLELRAPPLAERAEQWRIVVGPTWHVAFSGLPESITRDEVGAVHTFIFDPLPGETLRLEISRPDAAEGVTRAIDTLSLSTTLGARSSTHVVNLSLRSSQGGEQSIRLPSEATLSSVTHNDQAINARLLDGQLSLPVNPGQQDYRIEFQDNTGMGLNAHTPEVSVGLPAANVDLSINMPGDRWLLAATGPGVGPALLFWSELLVIIVVALLLSRWKDSPLRRHQWLLLGIGFSTVSWFAFAVVVAWLLALEWRKRHPIGNRWLFDLTQLALLGLTVAALVAMLSGIRSGLLGSPDMMVYGHNSDAGQLKWFADHSADVLPQARVISLPLWVYNLAMLAWALWLASATIGWLRTGFSAWTTDGYWKRLLRRKEQTPEPE